MLKYYGCAVVTAEFPDEITLAINISGCIGHCEGCSSPWLLKDIGTELTFDEITSLIDNEIFRIRFRFKDFRNCYIR